MNIQKNTIFPLFLGFLLTLLVALTTNTAEAYHFPWDQGHDTTDWGDPDELGTPDDPTNDCNKGQSSPVYTARGHFIWKDMDVSLAGKPSIDIRRTYNSHDPRDGIFGNGWSSNCEPLLTKTNNSDGTTSFIHRVTSGKRYTYIL